MVMTRPTKEVDPKKAAKPQSLAKLKGRKAVVANAEAVTDPVGDHLLSSASVSSVMLPASPAPTALTERILDALARSEYARLKSRTLCEQVEAGITEFKRALIELIETKQIKTEEIETDTLVYLACTDEEVKDYQRLTARAKSNEQFAAVKAASCIATCTVPSMSSYISNSATNTTGGRKRRNGSPFKTC